MLEKNNKQQHLFFHNPTIYALLASPITSIPRTNLNARSLAENHPLTAPLAEYIAYGHGVMEKVSSVDSHHNLSSWGDPTAGSVVSKFRLCHCHSFLFQRKMGWVMVWRKNDCYLLVQVWDEVKLNAEGK
ncbi:hypothetical protein TNIN_10111 [Trichonephila inaurata madagascariensis]|uniref:Uncharacterized protein n=1 Tax=Trichonephila inaurata madagascariensis TaxID=2747483 RepID=A0A8X7CB54_9ARAC|nr:hypothetical protein TNIN_10111 [Trichonephila inaurata madagascariensis]